MPELDPWPEPVDGSLLLDELAATLRRFVILPAWAPETLALWSLHTYSFHLRDVTTYLGLESPLKRCGKTTLLSVLAELAHLPVAAANISPPAFFRIIEELAPTLLIDEADTFLPGNDQLKGILNSGYSRKTAYVLRAGPLSAATSESPNSSSSFDPRPPSANQVTRFSCWCPKVLATIGRLPDTLADRCIVIRMHRKTNQEECARLRDLSVAPLRQKCKRFVLDNEQTIANARPVPPDGLNDRAADIWEPLFALADLAGGDWPHRARQAAAHLCACAQGNNPISSLLLDIFILFGISPEKRLFTCDLVDGLNLRFQGHPWSEARNGKDITDLWLAQQLRPYGIRPRTIWISGAHAKGYLEEDFLDTFRRYISRSDLEALKAEWKAEQPPPSADPKKAQ